jgi:hypothetical protein
MYLFSILFLVAIGLFLFVRNQSPTIIKNKTKTIQVFEQIKEQPTEQKEEICTPIIPISREKLTSRNLAFYQNKKQRNRKRNRIARKSRQNNRL